MFFYRLKKNRKIKNLYLKYLKIRNAIIAKISPVLLSKIMYKKTFRKKINLKKPVTFNEKIQWLKLYWQDPLISLCTDKYEVKNYLRNQGAGILLNDIYEVYENIEEINFETLPDKFVLKCTHGSGFNIICEDKSKLNKKEALKKLKKWLNTRYMLVAGEIHYDKIKPRIICEKFIKGKNNIELIDYKIYCFNGKPKFTNVIYNFKQGKEYKKYFFDNNWSVLPYNELSKLVKENNEQIPMPNYFKEMLAWCEVLSKPFPFVRIDFFDTEKGAILVEMTFTSLAGLDNELTREADLFIGSLLQLPKNKYISKK